MKIVPKNLGEEASRSRDEASLKQRIVKEICIQKSLDHPNIVMFKHAFEDQDNVYILLELCRKETLKEIIKKTGRLNEDLAKRYILQLANALKYIHKQKIIHRDVKLTNLFLTEKMDLKLGDFGLSIRLTCANDHRFTVCGTPDYVAPEVLKKCGYSYEADIWSLGVVAYHILIGKLPFDNPDQRVVMKKIMERNFSFPDDVEISHNAKHFISSILVLQPEKRPGLDQILTHPFLDSAHVALDADPNIFMTSSTCKEPLLSNIVLREKPIAGRQQTESPCTDRQIYKSPIFEGNTRASTRNFSSSPKKYRKSQFYSPSSTSKKEDKHIMKSGRSALEASSTPTQEQINSLNRKNYHKEKHHLSPFHTSFSSIKKNAQQPITINEIFVVKWLDYNSKYGMGYLLSNGLLGVIFNDNTQIFSFPQQQDGGYFEYFDQKLKNGKDALTVFNFKKYPESLETKVKLYFYFQDYLEKNRTGVSTLSNILISTDKENMHINGNTVMPVYINKWMKTEQAIFFKMSNKIVQVIFKDGAMLIINPFENTSRYINKNGEINNSMTNDSDDPDVDEMLQRVAYVKSELNEAWRNLNDS